MRSRVTYDVGGVTYNVGGVTQNVGGVTQNVGDVEFYLSTSAAVSICYPLSIESLLQASVLTSLSLL